MIHQDVIVDLKILVNKKLKTSAPTDKLKLKNHCCTNNGALCTSLERQVICKSIQRS